MSNPSREPVFIRPGLRVASILVATALSACGGGGASTPATGQGPSVPGSDSQAGMSVPGNAPTQPPVATPAPGPAPAPTPGAGSPTAPPPIASAPESQGNSPVIGGGGNPVPPTTPGTSPAPSAPVPAPAPSTEPPRTIGAAVAGSFGPVVDWPVVSIHTTMTPDGRVLTYGARVNGRQERKFYYDVWTPMLGTGPDAHTMLENVTGTFIFCSSSIVAPTTGRIIINGGDLLGPQDEVTNKPNNGITLFDPLTNSMTKAGTLRRARWYSSSTVLMNGDIFVQGGDGGQDVSEIVNGAGQSVRLIDGWNNRDLENNYPRNWIMPDGKIFGMDGEYWYTIDVDANNGRGARTVRDSWWWNRWGPTGSAAMYDIGRIAMFGGYERRISDVDLNGARPTEQEVGQLDELRQWVNSTVLPDGRILVSGGTELNPLADNETNNTKVGNIPKHTYLFDPYTKKLARTASMTQIRTYHSTALLLLDATVLHTGGGEPGPVTNLNAELFYPPYLYNEDGSLATRPAISSAPLAADPGSSFTIESPDADRIASAVLVKAGSVTHSNNMEQRRVPLRFTRNGSSLKLSLPANRFTTPPGYYMLFVLDQKGVPSIAKMLRINVQG